jgi:hypothetical protein
MLDVNGKESDSLDAVDPGGQVTQMFKNENWADQKNLQ